MGTDRAAQRGPWKSFTLKLFWALLSGSGVRPFIYALRLGLFVLAMLPGFVPYFLFYLLSPNIKRGVAYGDRWRQTLDVYLPQKPAGAPVVVFVSGGAWIIGNKAWAFLMGQTLQRNGVVCVSVDYRNYPQAAVPQMVDDVDAASFEARDVAARAAGTGKDSQVTRSRSRTRTWARRPKLPRRPRRR